MNTTDNTLSKTYYERGDLIRIHVVTYNLRPTNREEAKEVDTK